MLAILRAAGKRTLAKWNAFDFVVTIALGPSLATVILARATPPLQGRCSPQSGPPRAGRSR
jgi:uncharacterized membrane protein YcaP (DUF421 family)